MNLTYATEAQAETIFQALLKMLQYSPAPQMALAEPVVAYANLMKARDEGKLYVLGDFGILVDVGSPWHSSKPVLFEEIIIRFRRHFENTVDTAVEALERIAKLHGCVAVAAGDTQIGYMAPRYIAAGYRPLGTEFFKETP